MTPAAGRAEFEFGSWSVPELPASIEYPLEVMDEIRALACDELLQLSHGCREVGGVMFGTRRENGIRILTWRPIACEYAKGEILHLSAGDRLALAVQLERARVDPNLRDLRPVGWFVSHPLSEVFLTPSDLETYESFFPQPWQVTLVLHPAGGGVARSGFFQREPDGSLKTDASYKEFSLEPLHLTPGAAGIPGAEPSPPPRETIAPAMAEQNIVAKPGPALAAPSFQIEEPIPSKERWLWAIPIGLALALVILLLYYRQASPANSSPPVHEASQASSAQAGRDQDSKEAPAPPETATPVPRAQPADSSEVLRLRTERDQLAAQVQQRDAELRKERARADQLQNLVRILENRLNIRGDAATPGNGTQTAGVSHLK
jgi:hypothetical protein